MNTANNLTENGSNEIADEVPAWAYGEAFSRHRGLISTEEQQQLRSTRVAIAGMGGVGGIHLVTLARLGIGHFTVADPDIFATANFNRQYGARMPGLECNKAEVMTQEVKSINPEVDVTVFTEAIGDDNVNEFLRDVDVLVDGLDFFALQARRLLFREARCRGIWAVTAAPIGFSTAWLVFDPDGMSFDRYFDLNDSMDKIDQLAALAAGLAPRATHLPYFDLSLVNAGTGEAPSLGLACQLCAGVMATEVAKIVLGRRPIHTAPGYAQFDAYRQIFRQGRLRWGNRNPIQLLKRRILRRRLTGCV